MKMYSALFALFLVLAGGIDARAEKTPGATLDALHAAGAQADQVGFLALLTVDAVFLGMDNGNRLEGEALRDFVGEIFSGGKGWNYRSGHRETRLSPDGSVAWFDESLQHDQLGHGRGSGVLLRSAQGWKIAQYNITVPAPGSGLSPVANGAAETAVNSTPATTATVAPPEKPECRKLRHKTNKMAAC
jgi:hypothetical protein